MNKEKVFTIAIDGPCGAGKSSVANDVAKKLDIMHLDTGAMYRAVGLYMMRNEVNVKD
ncbi:MAG: (d)CMP kinase, partial [Clostridia bacterium]|nr:(d)CMP kinase [Clostridia bacterium]